jgi:hypothetical protein
MDLEFQGAKISAGCCTAYSKKHLFTACLLQIAAITMTKSMFKQHPSSCYLYLVDIDEKEGVTDGKDVRVAKQGKDSTKVRR